jgi:hypothetical protein
MDRGEDARSALANATTPGSEHVESSALFLELAKTRYDSGHLLEAAVGKPLDSGPRNESGRALRLDVLLSAAEHEAIRLGSRSVGTVELLIALLRTVGPDQRAIEADLGVTPSNAQALGDLIAQFGTTAAQPEMRTLPALDAVLPLGTSIEIGSELLELLAIEERGPVRILNWRFRSTNVGPGVGPRLEVEFENGFRVPAEIVFLYGWGEESRGASAFQALDGKLRVIRIHGRLRGADGELLLEPFSVEVA